MRSYYEEEEDGRDQDGQPFTLISHTTDNHVTDECENAGFFVIRNMEIIQQGLNLIYHLSVRYQESLRGAYYGSLLPSMEIDARRFYTLLPGTEAEVDR